MTIKALSRSSIQHPLVEAVMTNLVGLVSGGLHLLVDPALELIRVTEELLQVERVLQGGTARLSALMKGVASAQQLNNIQSTRWSLIMPQNMLNIYLIYPI